jgi:hypothetical protein
MPDEQIADVTISDYHSSDATAIVKLFYETVHLVNRRDYWVSGSSGAGNPLKPFPTSHKPQRANLRLR